MYKKDEQLQNSHHMSLNGHIYHNQMLDSMFYKNTEMQRHLETGMDKIIRNHVDKSQ